ncbi:MAG TPA: hypothetical protein VFS39_06505 [Nitrospira sp.]|nr:hypothetical protein [Nitrospira sp.]
MRTQRGLLSLFCATVILSGCAQPPTDQLNAAEQAVKDAQESGAGTYLPDEYAKLEGTVSAMKKEVADQEAKFALIRDYGKAEQLAASARAEAERVKAEAVKKLEEAKSAAVQVHRDAQEAVKTAMDLVAKAPAGKDRAALESIKTDVEALRASLNDVQMMIDKSDYLAAKAKAAAITEKSRAVAQEIETALAKIAKAKPAAGKRK